MALAMAGTLATPLEYFNPERRARLTERWGCGPSLEGYCSALWSRRTTAAGVFGTKLHWDQLVTLRAEALGVADSEPAYELDARFLERIVPGARAVRLLRRDVNRQAISLWFAIHTGTWSITASSEDPAARDVVEYSFDGIERCRRLIENQDVHWDRFLRFNRIASIDVVYEDAVADIAGTVDAVSRFVLGPGVPPPAGPLVPLTRQLADGHSERFLERFMADLGRRGWQDPRRG